MVKIIVTDDTGKVLIDREAEAMVLGGLTTDTEKKGKSEAAIFLYGTAPRILRIHKELNKKVIKQMLKQALHCIDDDREDCPASKQEEE